MPATTSRKSLIHKESTRPPQKASGKEPLTDPQSALLDAIKAFSDGHGYPPTRMELAGILRVGSATGVHQMLLILQRKGYISIAQNVSRGIRVL